MFRFASPAPSAFAGFGAPQPRYVERPSIEEQYFQRVAEEHERAATLARKRLIDVRRQRELEAQLELQQELAALQARATQRYHTRHALPSLGDVTFKFGANEGRDLYAERVYRENQERQKHAEKQAVIRALFEERRRAQVQRVAELQRKRALEVKAQQERQRKQEEARHLAAQAANEEHLRRFFQALVDAASQEGADLERKNAIHRNSAPAQEKPKDVPAPAPQSVPVPQRAASPAPSVASNSSDASLHSIAYLQDKYDSLRSGFTFPSTLVFAQSTSSPNSSPSLLYHPVNAPVHAYEHALTSLLTELDAVESFGDSHVRDVRRSLARSVEAELEALEARKRDAWRSQSVKVEVEIPAPIVESAPAPVVESAVPVESTPAAESTTTPESAPVDPVEFLASRLAAPAESEDDEIKAVRENLLARLTESEAPKEVEPVVETTETETEPKDIATTEPEPAADIATEPVTETEPIATEPEPTVESAPEPEVVDAHTSTSAPEIVVSTPEPVIVAPEPEVTPASPVESVSASSEPEVVVQSEPESALRSESGSLALTQPEPESTAAPEPTEPEHAPFVKVYPESDSDSDLASELADHKSTNGDEFELL